MAQVTKNTGLASAIRGCNSWQDIQIKWKAYSEDLKGYFFEEFVKAYLQIDCEYASKVKHVWHGREVPLAITKKLKLPVSDKGIDIVAETHEGEFWAIQCKYRQNTDQSLTWTELSTFAGLAFTVCRGISFGIVCSTTERYTDVLKDQENISFRALDVWQSLDSEFFKRLRAHLAKKPEVLKPLRPRDHQKFALMDGYAHFVTAKAKRGKLVMPCGTGKSLTAYFLAEKLEARSIVIAVPSLALIRQTLKVWLRETQANGQPVEWICVCSDESAGRVDRDDAAVLRQDLGVPCLTDTDEIARWLKRKHAGLTIVFTTYQSGEALAQAACSAKFRFDLGIMDEAHKTVGDRSKLFSHLLHDENLPIRRRLFMTATERRYAGQSDTVLSMDDPAIYGETFHLLSFKRAMEYNPPILSDYKIISMSVSRAEIAALIHENTFVVPDKGPWNQEIEAYMLASLIALRKAMAKYPIRHAVSFHGSIQRAELFRKHNDVFSHAHPELGQLATFHVSGQTPTGTRARVIGDFAKAERALVTNARCLTEGVDVPGIDCVLFADPRRSAVDIVQAVGRALRPAPGKEFGYVIVPILHDDNATANDLFSSDSFKEILTTLRALAANDDRIIEYFKAISQGQQRKGGASVQFDIDERLSERIDLAQFVREIELKCWDRLEGLLKDRLTTDQILVWADAYYKKTEQWPNVQSGEVDAQMGENWRSIDKALRHGNRGLNGGSSLAQLLADQRGHRNKKGLANLSVAKILEWADAYHQHTGKWPNANSGKVIGKPGEKWSNIHSALSVGTRGFPGGSTLAKVLSQYRGIRNMQSLPNLTITEILQWADTHHQRTGEWPNSDSGEVEGVPGEKWSNINSALKREVRSLSGCSSLAQLLADKRGVRNASRLTRLTTKQILEWAEAHHRQNGQWPNIQSGEVIGELGEKWLNIDTALRQGRRGLCGGSSLIRLLSERYEVKNRLFLSELTLEKILRWADAHHKRTGKWPTTHSGEIFGEVDEKWQNINAALIRGARGLTGGQSLAQLLATQRAVRNIRALPNLTTNQILKWADAHYLRDGKWPSATSGEVTGELSEKWGNIHAALRQGLRGLPGGSTLSQLIKSERNSK